MRVTSSHKMFLRGRSHHVKCFVMYFLITYGLIVGELPSVLCCARILVIFIWFEGKIDLLGAVGVNLFRVWLAWEEIPCQVRDCCKYLGVEGCQKNFPCLQGVSFLYLSSVQSPADWEDSWGDLSQ